MPAEFLHAHSALSARNTRGAQAASALTLTAMSLGYGVVQLDVTIVNVSSAEYHARQLVRIIAGASWDK